MFTLDTNAVIYYLRKEPQAFEAIKEILRANTPVYLSTVSELELFSYPALPKEEIEQLEVLLATLVIVPVDSRIARTAGLLRQLHRGLKSPDSAIAATALLTHTPLVTRNVKDFEKIKQSFELSLIAI